MYMSFFSKIKKIFKSNSDINCDDVEDLLAEADFGPKLAHELAQTSKNYDDLCAKLKKICINYVASLPCKLEKKPTVIMLVGVNGSGKTTTIAKLANYFQKSNISVDIAACDTFRAAATEQLEFWAKSIGCKIFSGDKKDPASVAYTAYETTQSDVLLIDTAGRLQNNTNLMAELSKISSVLHKLSGVAPITYLTLDATVGQNATQQAVEFNNACKLSGVILNKMDGRAKCGAIVNAICTVKIPIVAIGSGEKIDDLKEFVLDDFLKKLLET